MVSDRRCPGCGQPITYRELTSAESTRLLARIAWSSLVGAAVRPRSYLLSLGGPKGREMCCARCDRILRICPGCDEPYRWLSADPVACACGIVFM